MHIKLRFITQKIGSRWLGTNRLIRKLKRKFGAAYHSRLNRVANRDIAHLQTFQQPQFSTSQN